MATSEAVDRALERITNADAVWYASVRPDGRPHLAPIWHVWANNAVWVCTDMSTVRARNLASSGAVSLSLADTVTPVIIEGTAVRDESPTPEVLSEFKRKYDWDITDYKNRCLIRVIPVKMLLWNGSSEPFTRWRFKNNEWNAG